jgi:hypothetical protein
MWVRQYSGSWSGGKIERDEIEIDPAAVDRIAVGKHRPLEVAHGDRRLVCADLRGVADHVASEIFVDGSDRLYSGFMPALHRHQHVDRMLGDHIAVEDSMMRVAHQHQIIWIVSEFGRQDRIAARAIGGVSDDVADVRLIGVCRSGDLVTDQRRVTTGVLTATCGSGPHDRLDPLGNWFAPAFRYRHPRTILTKLRNCTHRTLVSKLIHDLFV